MHQHVHVKWILSSIPLLIHVTPDIHTNNFMSDLLCNIPCFFPKEVCELSLQIINCIGSPEIADFNIIILLSFAY